MIESRASQLAKYGLIGTMLVAVIGYGGYAAYEAITKHQQAEKQKLFLEKLAKVKPTTFSMVKLDTKYPPEKPDGVDWSKINAKSVILKKALVALQAKDDTTLVSSEFEMILSTSSAPWGNIEPPPEESDAQDELFAIIKEQPGLALILAEASKRILSNQVGLGKLGWYDNPDEWNLVAINNGSKKALNAYVEAKKKAHDYAALVTLYIGRTNWGFVDLPKVAEYFGLAVQSGATDLMGDKYVIDKIMGNGPQVASAAREYLLKSVQSAPIGNQKDLAKACSDSSSDITDPLNKGKGVFPDKKSGDEVSQCAAALFFAKGNKEIWYQFGYALQRNNEWDKAKIAYARAAELGHPMAIAQFWWIDFMVDQKRAIEMLQAEAKGGNPWGEYFLGVIYGGSYKDALDYKKSEQSFLKAIEAGITAAHLEMATNSIQQKKYSSAMKSWQQASEEFPIASWFIANQYEYGVNVGKDMDMAKRWYKKAADGGIEEASNALARLEKEASEAVAAAKQKAQPSDDVKKSAQRQSGQHIPAGTIICSSPRSFHKVNAIEMTGSQHASLPNDCETLGADVQVNILHYISDPVVGNLVQVGNSGGTVYVRLRDLP